MQPLTHDDLYSLEDYARERPAFRARVMAHKKPRAVHVGEHLTLLFEDRLSIHYQIQEMLRVERIFEDAGIRDELDTYNPLIPDGGNLKATMLVAYEDPEVRKRELVRLRGLEKAITLCVDGHAPVTAIADEDLKRSDDTRTSAVHFLRFELEPDMIAAWKDGAGVTLASTLPAMPVETRLNPEQRRALAADFQ